MEAIPTFEAAFRADYAAVVRVVSPIVGSVDDAEAVTQDAFLKAYVRWSRIGRYERPGAWVRRVAIRDAVRVAERGRRVPPEPSERADAVEGTAARLDLDRAIAALPPRQRACVVLHHLADWPVGEVAAALGCREGTVRVHLQRGRAALAAALRPGPEAEAEELPDGR